MNYAGLDEARIEEIVRASRAELLVHLSEDAGVKVEVDEPTLLPPDYLRYRDAAWAKGYAAMSYEMWFQDVKPHLIDP